MWGSVNAISSGAWCRRAFSKVNGVNWPAMGHASPYARPHGVYRAADPERFVAVSCEHQHQRDALGSLLGEPDEERLDAAVSSWVAQRTAAAAEAALIDAGVPASVVARPTDLHRDPQLQHRRFFVELDHPTLGRTPFDGPATQFSATPTMLFEAGPTIGQHTDEVLTDLLGFDRAQIERFAAAEVLR